MNTLEFLRLLFGEDAPDFLVVWTRQDKQARWLPASDLEAASRLAEQLAATHDVYCGVALQDKAAAIAKWRQENPDVRGEPTTRGYSETTRALLGLWVDVDVRSPTHKAVNLPPNKVAALDLIREFPFAPTIIVDSGYGLQAWWLFRELWVFENEVDRQAAQALARRFLATLQANGRVHGWQIDPTSDLARVLRLPGTVNRKREPVRVQVIELNETYRYNPSDFEPYLIDGPSAEGVIVRHWHGPAGALTPVLQHCRFLQHCRDNAVTLSEPEWWAMISNLARLDGGWEAIHALSASYPKYTISETNAKIRHALNSPGPHTCCYIQQQLSFAGCPSGGCRVKAPAVLGISRRAVQLAEAREQHTAAVEQTKQRRAAAIPLARKLQVQQAAMAA